MKCFACLPETHVNPYPDGDVAVTQLTLDSDLVLLRTREELQNRENGEDVYLVAAPFTVTWDGGTVTVPASFVTDLTSVPPIFRLFVSRAGPWLEAAVVHDYLYIAWQLITDRGAHPRDRKFADDIMFAAMTAAGVGRIRKWAIYLAVRAGGYWTYKKTYDDGLFGDITDARLVHLAAVPQDAATRMV